MGLKKNSNNILNAHQQIYRITENSAHASMLISKGYDSTSKIVSDPFNEFVENTGLNKVIADRYYVRALYVEYGESGNKEN